MDLSPPDRQRADRARASRHDLSMFNWPGNDYREDIDHRSPRRCRSRRRCRMPSGSASAFCTGCRPKRRLPAGAVRPSSSCVPTSWARRTDWPSFPTSARRAASRPCARSWSRMSRRTTSRAPVAAHFADSVGVGWYPIDIHRAGPEDVGVSCRTRPFQIPLGALIPVRISQSSRRGQEHRHDTHHQRLLPPSSRRMEHRRGCRRARRLLPRPRTIAGGSLWKPHIEGCISARFAPIGGTVDVGGRCWRQSSRVRHRPVTGNERPWTEFE